jgi:putative methionine-R-sulfoxide reductase with GAF domain
MVKSIAYSDFHIDSQRVKTFCELITQAINNNKQSHEQIQWQYQIPELGEGGTCSLFGELQAEPFNLSNYIESTPSNIQSMLALSAIVKFVAEQGILDWFGIYQTRDIDTQRQLLKLSYFGNPSRPLFPVSKEYAKISNNAFVALSGEGRVINNVESYVQSGGEYYTCDPKVQAEVCLPIIDKHGQVLGIIDAEAFTQEVFTPEVLALLTAVCDVLPDYLPE